MTTRRRFFHKVAALSASISGTFLLASCDRAEEQKAADDATGGAQDDDRRQQLLNSFVDTIVPQDEDPGAVEAGIATALAAYFESNRDKKKSAYAMLDTLDRFSREHFGVRFSTLNLNRREQVLALVIRSRKGGDQPAKDGIFRLRDTIIRHFYLSPTGQALLGYTPPYPHGYPNYNLPVVG